MAIERQEFPGYRVLNPHTEKRWGYPRNGNLQKPVVVGYRRVNIFIGSFMPKDEAERLAGELNAQKPLIQRIFPWKRARVVPEKNLS